MLQNLTKKIRSKPCLWLVRGIKTKTIDQGYVLRKVRKNKLENDITSYKMKRKEVNVCLRKAKLKYYQIYLMKVFDHWTNSEEKLRENIRKKTNSLYQVNILKLTQSLSQIQRSLQMALLSSIPRFFQN